MKKLSYLLAALLIISTSQLNASAPDTPFAAHHQARLLNKVESAIMTCREKIKKKLKRRGISELNHKQLVRYEDEMKGRVEGWFERSAPVYGIGTDYRKKYSTLSDLENSLLSSFNGYQHQCDSIIKRNGR